MNLLKKNGFLFVILAIVLLLILIPFIGLKTHIILFLFILMMNSSLAIGWNILGGYAGYVSFGHVAFVGLGGYFTAVLLVEFGWSPIYTTVLAGVVAALFALIIGYPSLRIRGPYFSVLTLVIALAVSAIVLNFPKIDASSGIFVTPPGDSIHSSSIILFEMMGISLLITIIVAQLIEKSKFGLGLFAIREDEEVASTQGVNTTKVKLAAFVISGGLGGLIGGIFSWYQGVLYVDAIFSVKLSVMIVLMAILGGTNSWVGALIGATIVTVIDRVLTLYIDSSVSQIIFGVLLLVVILYLPGGISGWFKDRFKSAT